MKTPQLLNYERDRWVAGDGNLAEIPSAIDGAPVAMTGSNGIDFGGMLRHAREVGGPALRKLTFHERARMIKALGLAIMARKEELYELNYLTGATRKDGWIPMRMRLWLATLLLVPGLAAAAGIDTLKTYLRDTSSASARSRSAASSPSSFA